MICADCGCSVSRTSNRQFRCCECKKKAAVARVTVWYLANKDRKREYDERRREEKRPLYREASKRHRQKHPEKKNAETRARRERIRLATPAWANKFFIREAYRLAALRTKVTGGKWHVDHIIPLNGKLVSGLHVENNLCVIYREANIRKSNHYSLEIGGIK